MGNKTDVNRWNIIHDFTKNEDGSKNYQEMDPQEWEMKIDELEGVEGEIGEIFPYPERYGGTIPDDADFTQDKNVFGGDNAFDIKDGKLDAQAIIEKKKKAEQEAAAALAASAKA